MSTPVFPKEGRVPELQLSLNNLNTNGRVILLKNAGATYDADYTYTSGDVATFSGYAAQTPVFPSATADGSGNGTSTAATLTFAHNGGGTSNTIYAWALRDNVDGKIRQLQRLEDGSGNPAPKTMAASGDSLAITLTLLEKQG